MPINKDINIQKNTDFLYLCAINPQIKAHSKGYSIIIIYAILYQF